MKRIVIIQGRPDAAGARFGHALATAYADGARNAGHAVDIVDVGRLEFPLLRSKEDFDQGEPPLSLTHLLKGKTGHVIVNGNARRNLPVVFPRARRARPGEEHSAFLRHGNHQGKPYRPGRVPQPEGAPQMAEANGCLWARGSVKTCWLDTLLGVAASKSADVTLCPRS